MNSKASSTLFDEDTSPWVEQVGKKPRAFLFHNFLTPAERSHIVKVAAPQMRRSTVSGPHGESVVDDIRTSYGTFLNRLSDPIIEAVQRRISLWTQLPMDHQEDMQVLRYSINQTYRAHLDSGNHKGEPGPQFRLATFLLYLSDVEEGGETAFPSGHSEWYDESQERAAHIAAAEGKISDCAKGNVAVKPRAGNGILFYSFHPNGTMDHNALHAGCPVIRGIKWSAPIWIHHDPFRPEEFERKLKQRSTLQTNGESTLSKMRKADPGMCMDFHKSCNEWASNGECKNNAPFMVGSNFAIGECRLSCGTCEICSPSDYTCRNRNRAKQGYLILDPKEMSWLGAESVFENSYKTDESSEL
nr:prolyl 4-hydroxylase (P4H) [Polytomella parva]|eukprot:CAMPEP_0175048226 /NCGR_PEP_ID=MMETSP0052_2-20121109/6058_1 /TAXON_ID=51329 ORGANISM="Polytomella parva, Strain SAG 63-3" /NCGR_SAMPLE_ID=MMETSP0052_2 /ASSEMBLY_ACC=CAM_ASM_000194 /LENGTH=357 /DNA_ID=CAMNT_0016312239 /DNA_START=98 /DNA_END=1171 /DNA_ORIENTATION=-